MATILAYNQKTGKVLKVDLLDYDYYFNGNIQNLPLEKDNMIIYKASNIEAILHRIFYFLLKFETKK